MPDDFGIDKSLFREIETGGGLNEGDILKAIERIDAEIEREETLNRSKRLEAASNANVHPSVAANELRAGSGLDISPEQVPEARKIAAQLSKVMTDSKLDPDTKSKSVDGYLQDLEQITLRSINQGGRKGVAVTGRTAAGKRASELRGFGSVPLDSGEVTMAPDGTPVSVSSGRFFPGPDKSKGDIEFEKMLQSLEPEFTVMSGEAGQRDIAGQKRRNAARMARFGAKQPKTKIAPAGTSVFQISEDGVKLLAKAPPTAKRTPIQEAKDLVTVKKVEKELNSNIPDSKELDKALTGLTNMYQSWYGDDVEGFWNEVIKYGRAHPGMDFSTFVIRAQDAIGSDDKPTPGQQGTLDALIGGGSLAPQSQGYLTKDRAQQLINEAKRRLGDNASPAQVNSLARQLATQ